MKATFIFLFLFFPLLSFAQLKTFEVKDKKGIPFKIFSDEKLNDAVIVFVYAPDLEEVKFKATQGWITGTEPKYDEEKFVENIVMKIY